MNRTRRPRKADDLPETVRIPIGEGTDLDGGPYFAAEVTAVTEGGLAVTDQEGNTRLESADDIEDHLSEEISRDEPVTVSGVTRDDAVATITLPLRAGFMVDLYGGRVYAVEEVEDRGEWSAVQDCIYQYGASYTPNR